MQKEVANKKIDELLHELPYYMNDFVIVKPLMNILLILFLNT